jgi:hypothetical protein
MDQIKTLVIRTLSIVAATSALCACSPAGPPSGTVKCAVTSRQCPSGYVCVPETGTCWKPGDIPPDGGTEPVDGPAGPDLAGIDQPADAPPGGEAGVILDQARVSPDGGGALDVALPDATDAPSADALPDAPLPDAPLPGPDAADAPATPDAALDGPVTCSPSKVDCNGICIDPPPAGCCTARECSGTCMSCGANHVCVAAKSQDDPNGVCPGTCDETGACKSKKGQRCQASPSTGCVAGTLCSPDGICCDRACSGSCEACDLAGAEGTCTALATAATPHTGHTPCAGTPPCTGSCGGNPDGSCTFPTTACGAAASCPTATTYRRGRGPGVHRTVCFLRRLFGPKLALRRHG